MYSIADYGQMIADKARTEAYVRALRAVVRPGSVVLDLGTGTGYFALMASRLGARRVFAVEPSDAIHVARDLASANGIRNIEFFQALSTRIELPERADVIVSDLRGILPLYREHLPAIVDARARHLAPGGTLIPLADSLRLALAEAPEMYRSIAEPWESSAALDMTGVRKLAVNAFVKLRGPPPRLLCEPQLLGTLDYTAIETSRFAARVETSATETGTAHGLCIWFDSTLATGVAFSNAPTEPRLIYGTAFFPLDRPVAVDRGDVLHIAIRADLVGSNYVWSWETEVRSGNALKARMQQSEFLGDPLAPQTLRRQSSAHVPALTEDGEIAHLVLGLADQRRTLGEIAAEVAARYPARFPRLNDALAHVGELSLLFSK